MTAEPENYVVIGDHCVDSATIVHCHTLEEATREAEEMRWRCWWLRVTVYYRVPY